MSNVHARQILQSAINKGFLVPAYEHDCVDCGAQAEDYDHRDYNKPLEVEPVCHRCNMKHGKGKPFIPVMAFRERPTKAERPEVNKLARYRKHCEMGQAEIAKRIGVTQGSICNWERGFRTPDIRSIKKLISIFKDHGIETDLDDLFPCESGDAA